MKKIIIFTALILMSTLAFSQSVSYADSCKNLRDSLFNLKANYIGQPLTKLISALHGNVTFAPPDNGYTRTLGAAYYQNITMFLDSKAGSPSRGFEIVLAQKVTIDLGQMRATAHSIWDNEMIGLLGTQTVVSMSKFQ